MGLNLTEYMNEISDLCEEYGDNDDTLDTIIFSMIAVAGQMGWELDVIDTSELDWDEEYLDTVPP
jgi:hypothetical protein